MTQYLLNVIQPTGATVEPEALERVMHELDAVNRELKDAGAWVFAAGLHPPSASTMVRVEGGELLTTDGPFAEGKEFIGGFTIIEAPDLDAALEWAGKVARASTLPIEVRPLHD